jgi:hypothetical protein
MDLKTTIAATLTSLLFLAACGNNSGTNGNQGQAYIANVPTPVTNQCMRSANVAAWWGPLQIQPYAMPSTSTPYGSNFCGCPGGTLPACSPQGMICVPAQNMNYNVAFWSWRSTYEGSWDFHPRFEVRNPYRSEARERRDWNDEIAQPEMRREGCRDRWGGDRRDCDRDHDRDHGRPRPVPAPAPVPYPAPQPYPNDGYGSCSVTSVAQTCNVVPGQPVLPGGMVCQPLSNNSPIGVWARR